MTVDALYILHLLPAASIQQPFDAYKSTLADIPPVMQVIQATEGTWHLTAHVFRMNAKLQQ